MTDDMNIDSDILYEIPFENFSLYYSTQKDYWYIEYYEDESQEVVEFMNEEFIVEGIKITPQMLDNYKKAIATSITGVN